MLSIFYIDILHIDGEMTPATVCRQKKWGTEVLERRLTADRSSGTF